MIEFEYDIEIEGHVIHASVEAEGHVYGHNYGEDADGNRGEWRVECEDIVLKITDGRGKDITAKLEKKYKRIFDDIDEEAYNKLIDAHYEAQEGPEYEPDET